MSQDIIYVCEECQYIFSEDEKEIADTEAVGKEMRLCKMHPRSKKPWRCEAYWQKYRAVKS